MEGGEGIAPDAIILPIRVLNDFNRGSLVSDFISASTYAQGQGARIINCSFGGSPFSFLEQLQVRWLADNDIILVCAAGNGGTDGQADSNDLVPQYPASYEGENIISVAAVDQYGRLTRFSNFGLRSVDIAAPGVDVFGADVSRSRVFFEDFEGFTSGWTTGELAGNESTDTWRLWEDRSFNTWLTDGSFDALLGPTRYTPNTNTYAEGPRIDLRNVEGPQLAVDVYYDLPGEFDSLSSIDLLLIEASIDRIVWDVVGFGYDTADPSEPRRAAFDLSPYEDQLLYLRFPFSHGRSIAGRWGLHRQCRGNSGRYFSVRRDAIQIWRWDVICRTHGEWSCRDDLVATSRSIYCPGQAGNSGRGDAPANIERPRGERRNAQRSKIAGDRDFLSKQRDRVIRRRGGSWARMEGFGLVWRLE